MDRSLGSPASTDVREAIAAAGGAIPFSAFMDLALYGPHGFYAERMAGRRGDFITSPEVGPLFGAVLGRYLDAVWDRLDRPDAFTVVEAGAGPGTLARSCSPLGRVCAAALRYVAVEVSAAQRARHPAGVESRGRHARGADRGVVLANELLDNLPFRLAVHDGDLARGVRDDGARRVVRRGALGAVRPACPRAAAPRRPTGRRAPLQDAAADWVLAARSHVRRGAVLVDRLHPGPHRRRSPRCRGGRGCARTATTSVASTTSPTRARRTSPSTSPSTSCPSPTRCAARPSSSSSTASTSSSTRAAPRGRAAAPTWTLTAHRAVEADALLDAQPGQPRRDGAARPGRDSAASSVLRVDGLPRSVDGSRGRFDRAGPRRSSASSPARSPEPEQPAAQPTSPLPPPLPTPTRTRPGRGAADVATTAASRHGAGRPRWPGRSRRSRLPVAGILALVVVIGAVAWTARPDDGLAEVERNEERFPTPTTLPPPTTRAGADPSVAPATGGHDGSRRRLRRRPRSPRRPDAARHAAPDAGADARTDAAPPPRAPTTVAPACRRGRRGPGATDGLRAAGRPRLHRHARPEPRRVRRAPLDARSSSRRRSTRLLASGRHDVAVPGPVALDLRGDADGPPARRPWPVGARRSSRRLDRPRAPRRARVRGVPHRTTASRSRTARTSTSAPTRTATSRPPAASSSARPASSSSSATTATHDICAVRIAPSTQPLLRGLRLRRASPIAPGATITLPVADVDQDVETVGCDDEELTSFSFRPDAETSPVARAVRPRSVLRNRPDRAGSDGQADGSSSVRSIP